MVFYIIFACLVDVELQQPPVSLFFFRCFAYFVDNNSHHHHHNNKIGSKTGGERRVKERGGLACSFFPSAFLEQHPTERPARPFGSRVYGNSQQCARKKEEDDVSACITRSTHTRTCARGKAASRVDCLAVKNNPPYDPPDNHGEQHPSLALETGQPVLLLRRPACVQFTPCLSCCSLRHTPHAPHAHSDTDGVDLVEQPSTAIL